MQSDQQLSGPSEGASEEDGFYRLFTFAKAPDDAQRPFHTLKSEGVSVVRISPQDAKQRFDDHAVLFIDVRDRDSFQYGHIPRAMSLTSGNLVDFLIRAHPRKAYIVYCSRGYTSIGAAGYLQENGFTDVSCLAGGFDAWVSQYPEVIESGIA